MDSWILLAASIIGKRIDDSTSAPLPTNQELAEIIREAFDDSPRYRVDQPH